MATIHCADAMNLSQERMKKLGWPSFRLQRYYLPPPEWYAEFHNGERSKAGQADTAPLAICGAALAALSPEGRGGA